MTDKPKALVWFTGVISKFKLPDIYLEDLQFNKQLLSKLQSTHDLVCIIQVKSVAEKERYLQRIHESYLGDNIYVFADYNKTDLEIISEAVRLYPDITMYVDSDRKRLVTASRFFKNENIFHLSQYLN